MTVQSGSMLSFCCLVSFCSCSKIESPTQSEVLRRPSNLCTIAESSRFVGRFELASDVGVGAQPVAVVLREAIVPKSPKDRLPETKGSPLSLLRAGTDGYSLRPTLWVREPMKAGEALWLFLIEQPTKFGQLEDTLAQGVFLRNRMGQFVNGVRYRDEETLSEAEFMREVLVGGTQEGERLCAESSPQVFVVDAGVDPGSEDAGSR